MSDFTTFRPGRLTDLPKWFIRVLESKGLKFRWLDYNQQKMYGFTDGRGYRPFQLSAHPEIKEAAKKAGEDVTFLCTDEGTIRRESMILGIAPAKKIQEYNDFFKQQNANAQKRIEELLKEKGRDIEVQEYVNEKMGPVPSNNILLKDE